jgi:WD40 repeat protein
VITVSLLRRILIAWSPQRLGQPADVWSDVPARRCARPQRYLLALSLLVCLTAQGCNKKLTIGHFVKAYCTIFSPDNKQVALGVLESERKERTAEDVRPRTRTTCRRWVTTPLVPTSDVHRPLPYLSAGCPDGQASTFLVGARQRRGVPAYSPDGRLLASGSEDSTVCLWDLRTGKRVHRLKGHSVKGKSVSVISLAFSPDGKTLVSRDDAGVEKRWDVVTGKEQSLRGDSPADPMTAGRMRGRKQTNGSKQRRHEAHLPGSPARLRGWFPLRGSPLMELHAAAAPTAPARRRSGTRLECGSAGKGQLPGPESLPARP